MLRCRVETMTACQDRRSAERGLSLLEVMIALVILAVGLLALASMQISSIQANTSGFASTAAVTLADRQLQQLKTLAYTDASLNEGVYAVGGTTMAGGNNIPYYLSYSVSDDDPIVGVKLITYTVAWSGNKVWHASEGVMTDCSVSPLPDNCHSVSLITRKCNEGLVKRCLLD